MAISKIDAAWTYAASAAADLSEKLHYFAKIDSNGKIAVCGDGEDIAGVIIETAVADKAATIAFGAINKVICAEAITPGARLASDTNGKAVAAAVGDFEAGTAINTAASVAGEVVPFLNIPGRRHA